MKYDDILHLSRPEPIKPRMSTLNRAKIFSPFAALRGYEDEIADQQREHRLIPKMALSEEDEDTLSAMLLQIKKGTPISVHYFKMDENRAPLGSYETVVGTVAKVDVTFREIEVYADDGKNTATGKKPPIRIAFDDLAEITITPDPSTYEEMR